MFSYMSGNPFTPGAFGETYAYSNLGFALLAQSIATSQGKLYHDLQREIVLKPLGLDHTQMYGTLGLKLENLPIGYDSQDSSAQSAPPGWPFFPAWGGAGALVSTPHDMMTWLLFNMGYIDSPLSGLLATLQSPSTTVRAKEIYNSQLGLAWFISTIPNSKGNTIQTVWKDGGLAGFSSLVEFLQSPNPGTTPSQAGVFVLTNSKGNAVYNIANDLLFIMSGLPPAEDKSVYPRVPGM
jgi:D-alanyl-D-alanine-carboxypeptidase/D-alanyl-D-alanine-endopeptidase